MGCISWCYLQIAITCNCRSSHRLSTIWINARKTWPSIYSIYCGNCWWLCGLPFIWVELKVDAFYLIELIQLSIPIPDSWLRNSRCSYVTQLESIGRQTHTDFWSRDIGCIDRLDISKGHILLVQLRCTRRMKLHLSRLFTFITIFLWHDC